MDPITLDKRCIKCGSTRFYPKETSGNKSSHVYECYECKKLFGYAMLEAFDEATKPVKTFELIRYNTEGLCYDQHGHFFAKIQVDSSDGEEHMEQVSLDTPEFRYWVENLYRRTQGDLVGKDTINTAIEALKGLIYESKKKTQTYIRCWFDKENKKLYYDLGDDKWRAIEVSKDGWRVMYDSANIFIRHNHMLPQSEPSKEYPKDAIDKLAELFNLKDASTKLLFKVYLVASFIPDFPHPMLVVHGDHGSAKSSFMKVIKSIVDPSSIPLMKFPKDDRNVMLAFMQNYLVYFDNMTNINKEQSDDLCRAVTGDGQFYRKLFEDEASKTYSFIRNIGMNGINNPAINPDLLDRVLSIELERIPSDRILTEAQLWRTVSDLKPQVLGYVFDTLAKALQIIDSVKVKYSHRLADFVEWGEAISRAMGYADNLFVSEYAANAQIQILTAIDNNVIASLIVKFVHSWKEDQREYTAEELLAALKEFAEASHVDYDDKQFPKTASVFARRLNIVKATLQDYGIKIQRYRNADTKLIKIIKVNTLLNPEYQAQNQSTVKVLGSTGTITAVASAAIEGETGKKEVILDNDSAKSTSTTTITPTNDNSIEYKGFKVTFDGKFYSCQVNNSKFKNIHLESIKHHIDCHVEKEVDKGGENLQGDAKEKHGLHGEEREGVNKP